jgi:hypothetical protein
LELKTHKNEGVVGKKGALYSLGLTETDNIRVTASINGKLTEAVALYQQPPQLTD